MFVMFGQFKRHSQVLNALRNQMFELVVIRHLSDYPVIHCLTELNCETY